MSFINPYERQSTNQKIRKTMRKKGWLYIIYHDLEYFPNNYIRRVLEPIHVWLRGVWMQSFWGESEVKEKGDRVVQWGVIEDQSQWDDIILDRGDLLSALKCITKNQVLIYYNKCFRLKSLNRVALTSLCKSPNRVLT